MLSLLARVGCWAQHRALRIQCISGHAPSAGYQGQCQDALGSLGVDVHPPTHSATTTNIYLISSEENHYAETKSILV